MGVAQEGMEVQEEAARLPLGENYT